MLADAPSSGDFIPISAGDLLLASAIGLVKSVSMKPGVHAFIVRLGFSLAKYIDYAFAQALEIP